NAPNSRHKSTSLADWRPILSAPGVVFVDLQYGDTLAERAAAGAELVHLQDMDLTNDLDGLAALTAACDLVITVSNTTAHLAGALGVPTWVLVATGWGSLWYWGAGTPDTPWYPTAKIFTRRSGQDWRPLLTEVAEALQGFRDSQASSDRSP
ncbi:MAG: hypothetical protein SFV21_22070, partial [Rhodospirillaceae bacterium]|nr:hypothetical protein [Rhodospirillaceae bacterium]